MQMIEILNTVERDLAMSARIKELVRERRSLIAAGRDSEAHTDEQIIETVNREMGMPAEPKTAPVIDVTKPQSLTPWSDADLDAMTANLSAEDAAELLDGRTGPMGELLRSDSSEGA